MTVPMNAKIQNAVKAMCETLKPKHDLTKVHPQYFIDKNDGLNVSPSDYNYPYEKPKQKEIETIGIYVEPVRHSHAMPTLDIDWPVLTEYDHTQTNVRPVEATRIELGHKIEQLESDLAFEKTNVLYAQQANQKLIDENRDWEVKFRNVEFANKQLQFQVDKIPNLKRTIRWMMVEHLDIELGDE